MERYIIGIDEAGRGPLAGPVAVGAVAFPPGFDWRLLDGVRDSKKLSPAAREEWYMRLGELEKGAGVRYAVRFSSAKVIDEQGIVPAVRNALGRALDRLALAPEECEVLLDGSLYAPERFVLQRTIIRGDDIEPAISLASIAAKVRRDRLMRRLAKRYPSYEFEAHKGYGTRTHRDALKRFGLCDVHRRSFCRNILKMV